MKTTSVKFVQFKSLHPHSNSKKLTESVTKTINISNLYNFYFVTIT